MFLFTDAGLNISRFLLCERSLEVIPAFAAKRAEKCSSRDRRSGCNERQQVGVNRVRFRGGHTVREALVTYKSCVLQQLSGPRTGGDIRHDLIVLAMHAQD